MVALWEINLEMIFQRSIVIWTGNKKRKNVVPVYSDKHGLSTWTNMRWVHPHHREDVSNTISRSCKSLLDALSETHNDQFMRKSKFELRQKWSEVPLCKDKSPRHQAVSTFHGSLGWSHSWTWGEAELSRWWKFKKPSKIPNSKYWTWSSCCELRGQSSGRLSGVDLPLTHRTHKPLDLWRQFALISESHQNQGDKTGLSMIFHLGEALMYLYSSCRLSSPSPLWKRCSTWWTFVFRRVKRRKR